VIRSIFKVLYRSAKKSRDKKFGVHLIAVWIFCLPLFGLIVTLLRHFYISAPLALIIVTFLLTCVVMYFIIGRYLSPKVVQEIRNEVVKDQSTKQYVIAQLLVILLLIVSSSLFFIFMTL
jgi:hypothetical protein